MSIRDDAGDLCGRSASRPPVSCAGCSACCVPATRPPRSRRSPGWPCCPRWSIRCAPQGWRVEQQIVGTVRDLPAGVDLAAYRTLQEGLTNAHKHATGSAVAVTVRYGPARAHPARWGDGGDQHRRRGPRRHDRVTAISPKVIGVAATTQYRAYQQTGMDGVGLSTGDRINASVSPVSSGGVTQQGRVPGCPRAGRRIHGLGRQLADAVGPVAANQL